MATIESALDFDTLHETVTSVFVEVYPVVASGEWVNYSLDEQLALRELVNLMVETGNGLVRPEFDSRVWEGHENGTVPTEVTSIRAQRQESTDKAPAKKPSPIDVLNRRLAK